MKIEGYDTAGCGCCAAPPPFPGRIANRPALSSISYRIGEYGSFRAHLVASIGKQSLLRDLRARGNQDYGIAILDLWAYLADILTFYQERIANEAFLRTATLRESVLRLAELIDYRLGPGSAAVAYLAFTLDKGKSLAVPARLRVQSVPGQNEKPQKFETDEQLAADASYNALPVYPLPAAFNPFATGNVDATLAPEDAAAFARPLVRGEKLVLVSPAALERKQLVAVVKEERQVWLRWDIPVLAAGLTPVDTRALAYDRVFSVFGANAPAEHMSVEPSSTAAGGFAWTLTTRKAIDYEIKLNDLPAGPAHSSPEAPSVQPPPEIPLSQKVDDLKAGARILLAARDAAGATVTRLTTAAAAEARPTAFAPFNDQVTHLTLGIAAQGPPAGVGGIKSRSFVFAVGDDGAVWLRASKGKGLFQDWQSLGGHVKSIAVLRDGSDLWRLFAAGMDGAVYTLRQTGAGEWGSWKSLGGEATELAAALRQNKRITLAARAWDGSVRVIEEEQPGTWGKWANIGGSVSHLAAGFGADATFYVFGIGADHAVWKNRRLAGGAWEGWESLGGWADLLAAGRNRNGRLAVFARGLDQNLHVNHQMAAAKWSGWSSLGGPLDQLAVATDRDCLVLLARRSDKALYVSRQAAPDASAYSPWSAPFGAAYPVDGFSAAENPDGHGFVAMRTPEGAVRWASLAANRPTALGYPVWSTADRRTLAVYEITRDPLALRQTSFAETISGGQVSLAATALASFETGRRIILDDGARRPHLADVIASHQEGDSLVVTFSPALERSLETKSAMLYGNVAKASHGETVRDEVLGSGDASRRFLSFAVKKAPVTYVPRAGMPNGVANTLELRVGGVLWKEVPSLYGRGSEERVYTTRLDNDGKMSVQFGGPPGARPPTGKNNIAATYRQGLGLAGMVAGRTLTTLLDRPAGLKGVVNPMAAEGGAEAETLEQARVNAPATVQTFGRIVSVRDFEDAARELAAVAKARAYVDWDGEEQSVFVVVAGSAGSSLENSVRDIAASLDAQRDINRKMRVLPHARLPIEVSLDVIAHGDYTLEAVRAAVGTALAGLFAFDNRELGQPVFFSDLYRVLQAAEGVVAADLDVLRPKGQADAPVMADIGVPPNAIAALDLADAAIRVAYGDFR